ncbi:MAG: YegS/Rv2252/BmrU family lipid kinase [Gammaproteobacteria bacterium]|nr:YegS/Rv2252/BmrU family lipid kinase [Gammaproteobacteria bacterium]
MTDWLISNDRSGQARKVEELRAQLAAVGLEVEHVDPELPVTNFAPGKGERVIIAGGDGTVRRYAAHVARHDAVLTVLPAGTGNDFARGLRIPLDIESACRVAAHGVVRTLDMALLDEKTFLNVAHIGFGTEVSRHVDAEQKRGWGRFAYVRTLFGRLRQSRGFKASIEHPGGRVRGRWLQISIANGNSFGGGQQFFGADPFDGQLDLLAIRPRSLLMLILLWLRAKIRRSPPPSEALLKLRGERFTVTGNRRLTVRADGEHLGNLPASFAVQPSALQVLVDADFHTKSGNMVG